MIVLGDSDTPWAESEVSMTDEQPEHAHAWVAATESDKAGYFAMNRMDEAPPWFVRLEKCSACSEHQVIARDSKTGKPVPRDAQYRS